MYIVHCFNILYDPSLTYLNIKRNWQKHQPIQHTNTIHINQAVHCTDEHVPSMLWRVRCTSNMMMIFIPIMFPSYEYVYFCCLTKGWNTMTYLNDCLLSVCMAHILQRNAENMCEKRYQDFINTFLRNFGSVELPERN